MRSSKGSGQKNGVILSDPSTLTGGRGTIFGACLGALIMASLDNGMSLLNVRDFMQDIIKGGILVTAVGLDVAGRKQS